MEAARARARVIRARQGHAVPLWVAYKRTAFCRRIPRTELLYCCWSARPGLHVRQAVRPVLARCTLVHNQQMPIAAARVCMCVLGASSASELAGRGGNLTRSGPSSTPQHPWALLKQSCLRESMFQAQPEADECGEDAWCWRTGDGSKHQVFLCEPRRAASTPTTSPTSAHRAPSLAGGLPASTSHPLVLAPAGGCEALQARLRHRG